MGTDSQNYLKLLFSTWDADGLVENACVRKVWLYFRVENVRRVLSNCSRSRESTRAALKIRVLGSIARDTIIISLKGNLRFCLVRVNDATDVSPANRGRASYRTPKRGPTNLETRFYARCRAFSPRNRRIHNRVRP